MAKSLIFSLIIVLLPFSAHAICFNATGFGDPSAEGDYFESGDTYNSDPVYINDNGWFVYRLVNGITWAMNSTDSEELFYAYYFDDVGDPIGSWTVQLGTSPAGSTSLIECTEVSTSTPTVISSLGSITFGISIIIVFLSFMLVSLIYNSVKSKKPWLYS